MFELGPGKHNPISLLTPISQERNGSLRDKSPADVYANHLGPSPDQVLTTHCVDPALFKEFKATKGWLQKFRSSREQLLRAFIIDELSL